MSKREKENDHNEVYLLLACRDVIDRFDTLIAEIRHTQKNIIYGLRTPELYQVLSLEEQLLWPQKNTKLNIWDDILNPKEDDPDYLIKRYILYYPEPFQHTNFNPTTEQHEKHSILKTLNPLVDRLFAHRVWNSDQRSQYHNLCALQKIKANIAKDKIKLSYETALYFSTKISNQDFAKNPKVPKLLLLRTLMCAKAREYLQPIRDLQAVYSRSQDFGLQDHPRPNVNRRRDQHLYSIHLETRCRDIDTEMNAFLDYLSVKKQPRPAYIYHRWIHDYTSHWHKFVDKLEPKNKSNKNKKYFFYTIDTSYWMPDRPDLQSCIAHEIAHTLLNARLGDLSFHELSSRDDNFSRFLKLCFQTIQHYHQLDENPEFAKAFWLELSADLLAASLNGGSYLYAIFLEILGAGLEDFFVSGTDKNDFDFGILELDKYNDENLIADWYCRIRVISTWIKQIQPDISSAPVQPLVFQLVNAVESLSQSLLDYLKKRSSKNPPENILFWEHLTNRLCKIVQESGSLTSQIKKWQTKLIEDHYKIRHDGTIETGPHEFPRSSRRLHWQVRNLLVEGMAARIREKIRGKGNHEEHCNIYSVIKLAELISPEYSRDKQDGNDQKLLCPTLFSRLYAIPWQYSLLQALEHVHKSSLLRPRDQAEWLSIISSTDESNKNFYQIALELYLDELSPSTHRLGDYIGWVASMVNTLKNTDLENIENIENIKELEDELNKWLTKTEDKEQGSPINSKDIEKFRNQINSVKAQKPKEPCVTSEIFVTEWEKIADKWSAQDLLKGNYRKENGDQPVLSEEKKPSSTELSRRLQRTCGYKLLLLQKILEKYLDVPNLNNIKEVYYSLKYRDNTDGNNCDSSFSERRKVILDYFRKSSPLGSFPRPLINNVLLARYYIANNYNVNFILSPSIPLYRYSLFYKIKNTEDPSQLKLDTCFSVIGRNDFVSIEYDFSNTWLLPKKLFPEKTGTNPCENKALRSFTSFFDRSELALKIETTSNSIKNDGYKSSPLALLAISLRRTTNRLDFIYRLNQALNKSGEGVGDGNPKYLSDLNKLGIDPSEIDIFLSDGWSDVILLFKTPSTSQDQDLRNYKRLKIVSDFQGIVFEDFMVDRTELIWTDESLKIVSGEQNSKDFTLSISVRLLEDGFVDQKNRTFENRVKEVIKKQFGDNNLFTFTRTPGRMDYTIRFPAGAIPDDKSKSAYWHLIEAFEVEAESQGGQVDRVITNLGRVVQSET